MITGQQIDFLIDKIGMFSASKISSIIIHETISNCISQFVSAL